MADFTVRTRIHTETLAANIERVIGRKLEKGLSDNVKRESANLLMDYSKKYVPLGATGTLRNSAKVVPYGNTYAVAYNAQGEPSKKTGKPREYAKAQYHANDVGWIRNTPGTYSHWNRHITKSEKRAMYSELASMIIEEMNNG